MLFRVTVITVALLLTTAVTAITTKTHQTCTPFNVAVVHANFLATMAANIHVIGEAQGVPVHEGSVCAKARFMALVNDIHLESPGPRAYLEMLLKLKNEMNEPYMECFNCGHCPGIRMFDMYEKIKNSGGIWSVSNEEADRRASTGYQTTRRSIHRCLDAAIVEFYGQSSYCVEVPPPVL